MTTENTNDFSVAKVGDRLWIRKEDYEGQAVVGCVSDDPKSVRPIMMLYEIGRTELFTKHGRVNPCGPQCLFWSKPEIIAPPRTKRMVKKVVEVRPAIGGSGRVYLEQWPNPYSEGYNWCGPAQPIEIMVEEE